MRTWTPHLARSVERSGFRTADQLCGGHSGQEFLNDDAAKMAGGTGDDDHGEALAPGRKVLWSGQSEFPLLTDLGTNAPEDGRIGSSGWTRSCGRWTASYHRRMPATRLRPRSPNDMLRQTKFANDRLARLGVEVMSLSALWQRMDHAVMLRAERIDFFMLLLVERGRGRHVIDFASFTLQPGSLVFVQPGQVQQWHPPGQMEGLMLMVDPRVMNPDTTRSSLQASLAREWQGWPAHAVLPAHARPAMRRWLRQIADECTRYDDSDLSVLLVRSMLSCLLLQAARTHSSPSVLATDIAPSDTALMRMLLGAIAARLRERPTVRSIAAEMGYSVSSLNRACLASEGRSAKAVIDHRVALEAQRLLVHSNDTAAQIGLSLGFSEPTNFLKFFKRVTGSSPERFRQLYGTALSPRATAAKLPRP